MRGKRRQALWNAPRNGGDTGYKAYRSGTHRTLAPAETVARVRPLMGAMGITRVANVTGLDRIGVPVVMVCRPNSRSIAVSQGKGLDLDAARASGLMEAAETYHAERIDLPLKLGAFEELKPGHRLVDVDALPRASGSSFGPGLSMLWIEGRDLLADEAPTWLPYELVHANYTLPLPPGSGCFPASTNGLASGNHRLEAACHGICEVIERDATSLWYQLDKPARDRTRVDLATVEDEACRDVLARFESAGLRVAVWNITTDVGVPSFYCMLTDAGDDAGHPGAGAGCHPARSVALLRALTEAAQVRMTYISGSRDDLPREQFTRSGLGEKLRDARALMATGRAPVQDFGAAPDRQSTTFGEDLDWLLSRLEAVGVEQVVGLDLTRPAFGLPVVRVVIPGLEGPHDHPGYVPGRRARAAAAAGRRRRP